jgi:tRNA pseudouridine32 synthase/23S rRNA pseudouridine746 synthase
MTNDNFAGGSPIPASRLYLPKFECPPETILRYVIARFPHISPSTWRERFARGLITVGDGTTLREDSPYCHGITVFYRKEVPSEPAPLEEELVVYQDEEILVTDKPHGMLVTPAGQDVERSLLVRLQRRTGLTSLAPMHRLDRDTAGILLFTIDPTLRRHYHRLFAKKMVEREYLAVTRLVNPPNQTQWRVENRMEPGDPWYCQRIVTGRPNTFTQVELLDCREGFGLFRLRPESGRKHQLRVHMASLGFPIVGDSLYPYVLAKQDGDPPLQLLASRLKFVDPLSGTARSFTTTRGLECTKICSPLLSRERPC